MDQKLKRIAIFIPFILISGLIGIRILQGDVSSSYCSTFWIFSKGENDMEHGETPENHTRLEIDHIMDECCGHTDSTPPVIALNASWGWNRFYNNSINTGGTTIDLLLTDDNPIDDNLPTKVLYQWDSQSNSSLSFPYNVILPTEKGLHLLSVYAKDGSENWASAVFCFVVGIPPPSIMLKSLTNETTILNDTSIELHVEDGIHGINQVLYSWDTNQGNSTLSYPYSVNSPIDNGTCKLSVYAENEVGNWTSAVFVFTITTDPSAVHTTTTTSLGRRTDGYLLLPASLILGGLAIIKTRFTRRKET
ncbi:MAG: hypothetical protein ACFFE8_15675 [Candidatus Heimdallarchaeota archaeon]